MSRPGSQPLRSYPGNVFQNQQPPTQRSQPLSSSRLQNGKLGNTSNWSFGLGAGGPGLPTQQARSSTSSSSFSQAIGGVQTQAQLDLSEFPSLSGAPASSQQQPNSSSQQSTWGSSSRLPQLSNGSRATGSANMPPQVIQAPNQMNSSQRRHADPSSDSYNSPFSQFGSSEEYRFSQGAQGMPSQSSDQYSGPDEFPPLGGLGVVDIGSSRRNGAEQPPQPNGSANGASFASSSRSAGRHGQIPSLEHPQDQSNQSGDRLFSPGEGSSRATPMSRSPFEHMEQDGTQGHDQQGGRASANSGQQGYNSSQSERLPFRSNQMAEQRYSQSGQDSNDPEDIHSIPGASEQGGPSQMSEIDRWGIPGLVETLRGGISEDQAALALGMDLSALGLDVHRPGNSPLHVDWAGPFAEQTARPIIPEFTLPQAYTVTNVPPLHTRIGSFSDDTLFMIFYQNPRDEAQELAAQELYKRDWRWHKKLQQWMMKAAEAPEPRVDHIRNEERGWYYFWDAHSWRRERREFLLSYDHLHHPLSQQQAEEALTSRS